MRQIVICNHVTWNSVRSWLAGSPSQWLGKLQVDVRFETNEIGTVADRLSTSPYNCHRRKPRPRLECTVSKTKLHCWYKMHRWPVSATVRCLATLAHNNQRCNEMSVLRSQKEPPLHAANWHAASFAKLCTADCMLLANIIWVFGLRHRPTGHKRRVTGTPP